MSPAPKRISPETKPLTRSERVVLDHIAMYCGPDRRLVQSTRYIADATFLCQKTVQEAITRLNELQLIRTVAGSVIRTSEHLYLKFPSPELLKPDGKKYQGRSPRVRIKVAAAGGAR